MSQERSAEAPCSYRFWRSKRCYVWTLAVLATVAALTAAVIHAKSIPWKSMHAALATYPTPSGFRVESVGQEGQRCLIVPSCQPPVLGESLVRTDGKDASCSDVVASVAAWRARGFVTRRDSGTNLGGSDCMVSGRIHGHVGVVTFVRRFSGIERPARIQVEIGP